MNYNVKGTEVSITDEIRSYVEKGLAHADKFLQGDTTAFTDVELQFLSGEREKKFRAEFTLSHSGEVLRAEARGDALHESIDLCVSELVRELRSAKKKKMHMFRHSAVRVKEYLRGWRSKI